MSATGDVARTADELVLSEVELRVDDDEWVALALEAGNIFGTPEWISTWWRHFGAGRRLLATACRGADGALIAVLPLYLWAGRRPLRVARFLGHGPGDALGPVCRGLDRPAVAVALERRLHEWDTPLLVGETAPAENRWSELLGARVVEREASPVLALDGMSWESLLASWSKNLRSQLEREATAERRHDAPRGSNRPPRREELRGPLELRAFLGNSHDRLTKRRLTRKRIPSDCTSEGPRRGPSVFRAHLRETDDNRLWRSS